MPKKRLRIALIGNPNCGKTTIFNALTGSNQMVGNWPGVTIEKKEGFFNLNSSEFDLIDIPGIYSLSNPSSVDETIAVNFIKSKDYDLILNVTNASTLERSLYLTTQLL